jgi:CRP-like cAMP-binding protein
MQTIAVQAALTKRKAKQKPAFDAQAFLDSAGEGNRVVEYRRSQKIYSQGDPTTGVMYIQKGSVTLSVVNEGGKEAVVAILGPGDFLGEECLTGRPIYLATATTIAPTTVLVIEKRDGARAP